MNSKRLLQTLVQQYGKEPGFLAIRCGLTQSLFICLEPYAEHVVSSESTTSQEKVFEGLEKFLSENIPEDGPQHVPFCAGFFSYEFFMFYRKYPSKKK